MTGGSKTAIDLETQPGWVFWITGLSGSGKSTIGWLLFQKLRSHCRNAVFLDGDELRRVFGSESGYSLEERRTCARRYSHLGRMLSEQGLHVVLATISMFHETRKWNRANLPKYFEIYLRAPMNVLIARDSRGLYEQARSGEAAQVVGADLPFEEPVNPDLVIDNDGSEAPEDIAAQIWILVRPNLDCVQIEKPPADCAGRTGKHLVD